MEHLQRGNKLWESYRMFLPEHKEALFKRKREIKRIEKPLLDEDALEQLQLQLVTILHQNSISRFTYYEDGQLFSVDGQVAKIHSLERWLIISNEEENKKISLENLLAIH